MPQASREMFNLSSDPANIMQYMQEQMQAQMQSMMAQFQTHLLEEAQRLRPQEAGPSMSSGPVLDPQGQYDWEGGEPGQEEDEAMSNISGLTGTQEPRPPGPPGGAESWATTPSWEFAGDDDGL